MTSDQPKAKIFISYSRKDMAFADRLDAVLKARGFEPLIDRSDIHVFEDWWERIKGLIGEADTIIFVLSPDAVASPVCAKEIDYAASLNKRFAPIVCRQVEGGMVPAALGRLNFLFFDDLERFEANADQLVEICVLRGHQDAVWSAAFSPDGARIVTASDDKTARIWDVHFAMMPTLDLIDEVCARRLRGMTKMQRDEMRLAGYPDTMLEIDVADGMYVTD